MNLLVITVIKRTRLQNVSEAFTGDSELLEESDSAYYREPKKCCFVTVPVICFYFQDEAAQDI